jgi:peptidoglycan/LPS O-acetylase OafA/YrhL
MNNDSKFDVRLDIVRFLAFFAVFFTHFVNAGGNAIQDAGDVWWNKVPIQRLADFGGQGVPIFFALTGFLLGRLLIREYKNTHSVSIKSFYLRRIFRIWPLYFLYLVICFLANPFASGTPAINQSEIPFYLTFTYNWGQIYGNLPGSMATITWSVSVEEQIYLVLPLFIYFINYKRFEITAFLLVTLGTLSLLLSDFDFIPGFARVTTSYFLPVGIGLIVALKEEKIRSTNRKARYLRWVVLLLSITYVLVFPELSDFLLSGTITMALTSVLFVGLIFISDNFIKEEKIFVRIIGRIGRVSYGCYLYHWTIWSIMTGKEIFYSSAKGFSIFGVLIALIVTILVSEVSYRFFETWFLKKRKKYQVVESP